MTLLLATAAALGAGAVGVLVTSTAPGLARRSRGPLIEAVILGSAACALLVRSAPTGLLPVDLVLSAGLAALGSWAAARASHRQVMVVAGLALPLLDFSPAASAGLGISVAVVLLKTRLPLLKAVAGGLLGLALLAQIGTRGGSWPEAVSFILLLALARNAARRTSPRALRNFRIGFSACAAFVVLSIAAFAFFVVPASQELIRAVNLSRGAAETLTTSRSAGTGTSFALAATSFRTAHARLSEWPARLIEAVPGAAQNAVALRTLADAGEGVASAAAGATTGPADLRVGDGGVNLEAVSKASSGVGQARLSVQSALSDLEAVRSPSLLPPLAEGTADLRNQLASAAPTLATIDRALEHLPALLGADGPRRYFLALQTPSESRAAGGIIGAFAEIEAQGGQLRLTRTGRAPELNRAGDPSARSVAGVDEYLGRYGRFLPLQTWQNLSLSPDWPTVGTVVDQLFPQSGGQPVDTVIGLDPFALAAILSATGPIDVAPWPVPISADNAVAILLHEQYLFFPNPERQEFLADVTAVVFERLTGEGASLRALAIALAESSDRRNIQLWSEREAEQELFDDIETTGGFPGKEVEGDFLSVVTQNSSGNKIDWFLRRSTTVDVVYDPELGRADTTATIELRNEAPAGGLPDYVIGSAGPQASQTAPGENRLYVSVYSPADLQGATLDGEPLEMERATELGHNVYSAFVVIGPQSSRTLELRLRGVVDPVRDSYRLRVRPQVLPAAETAQVRVRFADGWEPAGKLRPSQVLLVDKVWSMSFRRSR